MHPSRPPTWGGVTLEFATIDAASGAVLLEALVDPGDVLIHPDAAVVQGLSVDQLAPPGLWSSLSWRR